MNKELEERKMKEDKKLREEDKNSYNTKEEKRRD